MKLSERAMLVHLHTGTWGSQTTDHTVTEEVSESHKAEAGAGHYRKQLVARKFLSHVNSHINAARQTHKVLTLPWEDNGTRILSANGYMKYAEQMKLCRHAVEAAAAEFSQHMDDYIAEAKVRLGTMFNPDEYPAYNDVPGKFYVNVEVKPIPEGNDFRTQLSEKTVKAIVADIEQRSKDRLESAMDDIYKRIVDVTARMVERLRAFQPGEDGEGAQNRFKDSLVYNVKELAELLPVLNIPGDKRIEDMRVKMLRDLTDNAPELLRSDARLRSKTADKAEKILAKAQAYLG
jgi:hypothetical protein